MSLLRCWCWLVPARNKEKREYNSAKKRGAKDPFLPHVLLRGAEITKAPMLLLSLSNAKGSFTASCVTEI